MAHDDLILRDNVFPLTLKILRTLNRRNRNAALVAAPHLSTSPDSAGALCLEVRTVVACGSSWMCEGKTVTVQHERTEFSRI